MKRCEWAKGEYNESYHDNEWGKPQHHDQKLFELLVLEGMQAGLSWVTILKKREAFCEAFDQFDIDLKHLFLKSTVKYYFHYIK